MPKLGRLLAFPTPGPRSLSPAEAAILATEFLSRQNETHLDEEWERLEDPEFTQACVFALAKSVNADPRRSYETAKAMHARVEAIPSLGIFDERDFLLGELALIAGNSARMVGQLDESEAWLDLAEGFFRQTVNSGPSLTRVAHARLAVRYQSHKYSHVLTLLPRVITEYAKYGMVTEKNKARYLYASTLKAAGDSDAALAEFLSISNTFADQEAAFRALVLTSVAEEYARRSSDEAADEYYQAAISAVELSEDSIAEAHLKASVGEAYRSKGQHDRAVDCLRSSAAKYAAVGMDSQAAYIRILLAESLLAGNREREAEWEILAALQTIESLRMVVEGFAAVELLRESVSRRQTDRSALGALRGQIKNSR